MEAELIAKSRRVPFPHVVFPRNINDISTEEIRAAVDKVSEQLAELLTSPTKVLRPR